MHSFNGFSAEPAFYRFPRIPSPYPECPNTQNYRYTIIFAYLDPQGTLAGFVGADTLYKQFIMKYMKLPFNQNKPVDQMTKAIAFERCRSFPIGTLHLMDPRDHTGASCLGCKTLSSFRVHASSITHLRLSSKLHVYFSGKEGNYYLHYPDKETYSSHVSSATPLKAKPVAHRRVNAALSPIFWHRSSWANMGILTWRRIRPGCRRIWKGLALWLRISPTLSRLGCAQASSTSLDIRGFPIHSTGV